MDVIIVGIMDAMAGTTAVAVDADVVITTDAVEEIPSVKASARDTGRATMMHCGTAAAAAVDAVAAAAQADRVLVMSRGRIVMEGTPEQVFSQTERLHSYHLDVPQAAELRDELVKLGIPMPENVITPEACAEELFKLLK